MSSVTFKNAMNMLFCYEHIACGYDLVVKSTGEKHNFLRNFLTVFLTNFTKNFLLFCSYTLIIQIFAGDFIY